MFDVEQPSHCAPSGASLKRRMKKLGVVYRTAAPAINVCLSYFTEVLNGQRKHPGYAMRNRLAAFLDQVESAKRAEGK